MLRYQIRGESLSCQFTILNLRQSFDCPQLVIDDGEERNVLRNVRRGDENSQVNEKTRGYQLLFV